MRPDPLRSQTFVVLGAGNARAKQRSFHTLFGFFLAEGIRKKPDGQIILSFRGQMALMARAG